MSSEGDDHVTITLYSLGADPGSPHTTRTIQLFHNQPVPVGRASKVLEKGYVAGPNNAWYDSAVMSRKHAELSADLMDKCVKVADQESLHGTYVNRERIEKDVSQTLVDGDVIDFGMSIHRNHEDHPPTRVRVNFNFMDQASEQPRVYRPPESIDSEGLGDDDGGVKEVEPSSQDHDLTMMRAYAAREVLQQHLALASTVDLTGDDEINPAEGQVIDLTGEPSALRATTAFNQGLNMVSDAPLELESELGPEPADSLDSNVVSEDDLSNWGTENEGAMAEGSSVASSDSGVDNEVHGMYDDSEDDGIDADPMSSDYGDEDPLPGNYTSLWDDYDSDADIPDDLDDFDKTVRRLSPPCASPVCVMGAAQEAPEINLVCSIPALLNPTASAESSTVSYNEGPPLLSAPMADLGARIGRVKFFEARAANKLTVERNAAAAGCDAIDSQPDSKGKEPAEPVEDLSVGVSPPEESEEAAPSTTPAEQNEVKLPCPQGGLSANISEAQVETLITTDLLQTGERFLHSPPEDHKLDDERFSEGDDEGMLSAATFHQHKLAKLKEAQSSSHKRKAESISEEDVVVEPLTPTSEEGNVVVPGAVVQQPAKRPATEAAVAKAKGRGTAWAIAEKMGLAALGGAMVFGALVSSAPAL